jgi:hypothetical protein
MFTADVRETAGWLVEKGARSLAMQSTGVYGMPVLEVLEPHGLEVFLVNAPHTQNVPRRKSHVQECPWLLKLHAFGRLPNRFQPTDEIRIARTRWRHRGHLVAEAGSAIQRMQKAWTEMNIQLRFTGLLSSDYTAGHHGLQPCQQAGPSRPCIGSEAGKLQEDSAHAPGINGGSAT